MICKQCGSKIPDSYLQSPSFRCPGCGKQYIRRSPQVAASQKRRVGNVHRKNNGSFLSKRNLIIGGTILLILIVILVIIIASNGRSNRDVSVSLPIASSQTSSSKALSAEEMKILTKIDTLYKVPVYSEYNSYAEENGNDGDFLRIHGTITEYGTTDNMKYLILETANHEKWLAIVGYENMVNQDFLDKEGKTVDICGQYMGYSDVYSLPTVMMLFSGGFIMEDGSFVGTLPTEEDITSQSVESVQVTPTATTVPNSVTSAYPLEVFNNYGLVITIENINYYQPYGSISGIEISMVIENNNDVQMSFHCGDLYTGEWKVTSAILLSDDIAAHSKVRNTLTVWEEDLKNAGLTPYNALNASYRIADCYFMTDSYQKSDEFDLVFP